MWYSPVPMCMFNSVAHGLGNKGCAACDGLLSVAANGDVLPCASFDESVGNLLEQEVDSVWQSRRAKLHRSKFWPTRSAAPVPSSRSVRERALSTGDGWDSTS